MCGIVGYVGNKHNPINVLLDGLKSLEYRGYDSAGIAFIQNNKLKIVKTSGKVKILEEEINKISMDDISVGIGHTRWATHGIPNDINAHPHNVGDVTIVHNGIIENYGELKEILIKSGYQFKSETDTEVLCALIDDISKKEKNKIRVLNRVSKYLKGSYAVGIIFNDDKDSIYAMRKNSPLIIAVGDKENFIASDVPAVLNYTKKYILLDEDECARITNDKIEVYNSKLEIIKKDIKEASWTVDQSKKDNYEHFMLKEIYEEPKTVSNIINRYINGSCYGIANKMIDFTKYEDIHIVACGSAMHAGMIGKYLIEKYVPIKVSVEIASEYRYRNIVFNKKTLVIIISQSGETADSLAALKMAKEHGIDTLAIVNVIGSSIARMAKNVIYMEAGPEIAVATTKALSVQVAILSLIALNLYITKVSKVKLDLEVLYNDYKNIDIYLNKALSYRDLYKDIASHIYKSEHLFFIGRGIDYALCMEGSLKLKEISYIHSEAYPAGELKHGTISLIEPNTPVIALVTDKSLRDKTISNVKETRARGAYIIYITTEDLDIEDNFYDQKIILPTTNDFISPLITLIPLQLIAYETARMKDLDIDKPRNLAKSVTVE